MSNEISTTNIPRSSDNPSSTVPPYENYKERNQYKFLTFYAKVEDVAYYFKNRVNQGAVLSWGYILHTGETFADGTPKKDHIHALVKYANQKTDRACKTDFKHCNFKQSDGNPAVIHYAETTFNRQSALQYLTHENEKDKKTYDKNDIVCSDNFFSIFDVCINNEDNDNVCYCILKDLVSGVSLVDLVRIYGKDFVYHYHNYKDILNDLGGVKNAQENLFQ